MKKNEIATDVIEMRLDKPKNFQFISGQFVQFHIPLNNSFILRSYSIASASEDDVLLFCIKLMENGIASNFFRKIPTNSKINFQGPVGRFVLDTNEPSYHLIATGAGLTPFMSILRHELIYAKNQKKIHLLFGVRNLGDIFWQKELKGLRKKYNNFTYQITLSKPENHWDGLKGRVTHHVSQESKGSGFYLCGGVEMVKDVRAILRANNIDAKQIHFEIF